MRISDWSSDVCSSDLTSFRTLKSVQAINQSVDYCDPNADTCTGLTQDWPTQTFSTSVSGTTIIKIITDQDDNATAVGTVDGKVTEVTTPTTSDTGEKQVSRSTERRVGKEGVSTCRSRW